MAYLTAAEWFAGTSPWVLGLGLSTADVGTATLNDLITEMSAAFDTYTDDHFESSTGTITVDSVGGALLRVPKRIQAVTLLETQDYTGAWTTEVSTAYRYEAFTGDARQVEVDDVIEIVPGQALASGSATWPVGFQTVRLSGTFDWASCPMDVKRAVALMCWERVKSPGDSLRLSQRWQTQAESFDRSLTTPTGMPEADEIIARYRRIRVVAG